MNCHGSAKIKDVIDYLCHDDGMYKYIVGAPEIKKKRNDDDSRKATEFVELWLRSEVKDEMGKNFEFQLNPMINLDTVHKYLFSLIDIEGKAKHMPFYYQIKDPSKSLLKDKQPRQKISENNL